MSFENKMVAVMNKKANTGVIMNALGHMSLGIGAHVGRKTLRLDTYVDKEENRYPNISQMPFIILEGSSNKIRNLYQWAKENEIVHSVFLETMTGGTYLEQLARTKEKIESELTFFGITIFGPWDMVSEATRKFSLWK